MYSHLYPEIFTAQTQWITKNVEALNIAYVLHEGDIVNIPGPSTQQWERAAASMNVLDGVVPYAFVPGNHDYDDEGATRAASMYNRFFPFEKFRNTPTFGGAYIDGNMDNTFHLFRAGGTDWLILCLEFGPRNEVLQWAGQIADKYPARRIIVLTHAYLYYNNSLHGSDLAQASLPSKMGIGAQPGGANNGQEMWSKFISQHRNIQFVFSGHTAGDGVGRRIDFGKSGNSIFQIVANFQYRDNGGDGYLRIILFDPSKGKASVKTYSPWLNKEIVDSDNQFELNGVDFGAP